MDQEQKIVVPHSIFYSPGKENLVNAKNWLASQGIIVNSKAGWTFLHQTFFDYCYARNFVENGGNIVDEILHSPQGIFERSKIIQVLTYLRGFNHQAYIQEYKKLVNSSNLRFHLQDLLIRWFGSIPNPSEEEKCYVFQLLMEPTKRSSYFTAMFGYVQWFGFLISNVLPYWLSQENDFIDTYVIPYLNSLVNIDQLQVVLFLKQYQDRGEKWQNRIYSVLLRINKVITREAAILLTDLVIKLPVINQHDWYEISLVAKAYPDLGCKLINLALDNGLTEYSAKKSSSEGDPGGSKFTTIGCVLDHFDQVQLDEALKEISEREPLLILDVLVNWLDKYFSLLTMPIDDPLWFSWDEFYDSWNDNLFRVRGAFIQSLISSAIFLAKTNSDKFKAYSSKWAASPFATYQRLLTRVYSSLPEYYAKDALAFLLSDSRRLNLGSNACTESRRLIHLICPYLDPHERLDLEKLILSYFPIYKHLGIRALNRRGLDQLYLLETLPSEMLSSYGLKKLQELRHKFPNIKVPLDESWSMVDLSDHQFQKA